MAAKKPEAKTQQNSLYGSVQTLAAALAEKGGPGLTLLGLICCSGWLATLLFIGLAFPNLPELKAPYHNGNWYAYLFILIAGTVLLGFISYKITQLVIGSIVGTIRAEAESKALTTAFGGRVAALDGSIALSRLPEDQATRRIKDIQQALVDHSARMLRVRQDEVRSSIFTTTDGIWLDIDQKLHVHMRGASDLTIRILNGFYSTGTAYRWARATVSALGSTGESDWQHRPDPASLKKMGYDPSLQDPAEKEIEKGAKNLQWIVSMPIPIQVSPFRLTCGVLSLDGFKKILHRDELRILLADAATAAALIGVVNRTTDILRSQCQRPDQHQATGGVLSTFDIPESDFDPSECPEPTADFTRALAQVKGLEFLRNVSPTELALFVREQLRY